MFINHITSHDMVATTAEDEHHPEGVSWYTLWGVEVQQRFEHASVGVEVLRRVDQRRDGKAIGNKINWWPCNCKFRVT